MKKWASKRPRAMQKKRTSTNGRSKSAKTGQKRNQNNDPEGLALTKNDILGFCDRVLKKWQQDPVQNARHIPAMLAVRTSVFFSDEASLGAIWSEIISWVYQMLYENAQAQARKEGLEWAGVFSKIKNE